jgi:hypothetical protein
VTPVGLGHDRDSLITGRISSGDARVVRPLVEMVEAGIVGQAGLSPSTLRTITTSATQTNAVAEVDHMVTRRARKARCRMT